MATLPIFTAVLAFLSTLPQSLASPPSTAVLPYPNVASHSHATPALTKTVKSYFTAKSLHNATAWLAHFGPRAIYTDSVVGFTFGPGPSLKTNIRQLVASWPAEDALSYPLRILGGTDSTAVVFFEDTPGLFGVEIRGMSAVTFDGEGGRVVRIVDYWDGRGNSFASKNRVDDSVFPAEFGEGMYPGRRGRGMQKVVESLHGALTGGNTSAVGALLSLDAVFEDSTLRLRVEGRSAIERYLSRAVSLLPYGPGAGIRYVLGNHLGGGYEWFSGRGDVTHHGITAVELDGDGMITRFTALWDASRAGSASMMALAGLAIEP